MNIQEFARQLGREDHPSHMIQALQALRSFDLERFRGLEAAGPEWAPWADEQPRSYAERPELRS